MNSSDNTRFIAVVKADCPTCHLVIPALEKIAANAQIEIFVQDESAPFAALNASIDPELAVSYKRRIETVPTLIALRDDNEVGRCVGWSRAEWQETTHIAFPTIEPPYQPGCGALNVSPGMPEKLALRFGDIRLQSRSVPVPGEQDPMELAFDNGWTDGLPVTPPTDLRIARMLGGTQRNPQEHLGRIPPNLNPCTVEKAAINAVLAGCRPEYFPVVLASIETALLPQFAMHGLLCTLHSAAPVIIVNGPVAKRIGMNWRGNALGQGNRANATIGRALQLIIRNIGGGIPQQIDRAVLGHPGKITFCFAEDETDASWTPLSVSRGFKPDESTVTLFQGEGPAVIADARARSADELAHSLAMGLWNVTHPRLARGGGGAILVLSPDHYDVFRQENWGRAEIEAALRHYLQRPASEIHAGLDGVGMGSDPKLGDEPVAKFHDDSFLVVRAGGAGGPLSAMIGGWSAQRNPLEVQPVTRRIGD